MGQSEFHYNCGRWRARNLQSNQDVDPSFAESPARLSPHSLLRQIGYAAPPWLKGLAVFLLILAGVYILVLLGLNLLRLSYPYELEWTEGAVIEEIRWILSGKPLYTTPDIHFLPLAYNPLYFYLAALPSKILGMGYLAPRLVSVLANLGVLILLFIAVANESKNWAAGWIAAGVYAASFRATGAWVDLAKTDSLFIFLILAGFLLLLRFHRRHVKVTGYKARDWLLITGTALLFSMAYFTKQTALPILIVLMIASLILSRGYSWPIWLTTGLLTILSFLALDAITRGWFSFYTVDILATHAQVSLWRFWETLLPAFWPALVIGIILSIEYVRRLVSKGNNSPVLQDSQQNEITARLRKKNSAAWLILSLVFALILASWTIYTKAWTYTNGSNPGCSRARAGLRYGVRRVLIPNQRDRR